MQKNNVIHCGHGNTNTIYIIINSKLVATNKENDPGLMTTDSLKCETFAYLGMYYFMKQLSH